jgi:site-specific DNA recombinase
MKTFGYVRVSTEKQAERGCSLDAQAEKIRDGPGAGQRALRDHRRKRRMGQELNRPGMTKLLALVDAGKVKGVIVAKLDRLTQSVKDLCELLERFERRGVALRLL